MPNAAQAFQVIPSDGYSTLKLAGTLGIDTAKQFTLQVDELLKEPTNFVINCESANDISVQWLRALLQFQQRLKSTNCQLRLLSVSDSLSRILKQEGLDLSLKISPSLRTALTDFGVVSSVKSFDVNFINPFLTATIKVLQTQASTQATAGQVYKKETHNKFLGDISGVIGLVSEAFSGSVVISFPASTFLKVVSRMIGEEQTEMTKEIEDGAGELTNIIFGQAKVILNEKGYGIKTALPSVVAGADHSILHMTTGPRVVIPFESDAGPFFVEVCVSG